MAVTVRAYDETWPQRFEVERARLSALLGGSVSRIEHIGSTSVPGLAAKPIIDILVGTDRLDRLDACNAAMRAAGYQVKGEYGLPGRRYFRRDAANGVRLVHIHAYQTESDGFRRHLVAITDDPTHRRKGNPMTHPTRTRSDSLAAGGLNWNSLPLKLFAGGNAKFWNPADIDFSRDRADWEGLTELEREWATRLCAQFIAGEEAVTQDIQPFMAAMRAEGRLGDEMYLTQFAFEEAKHTQVFRLWLDAVGVTDDLQGFLDDLPTYRTIFYEKLPESLDALLTDPSPAALAARPGLDKMVATRPKI